MTSAAQGPAAGRTWWTRALVASFASMIAALAALTPARAQDEPDAEALDQPGGVVVVGVPGLTWSDISASETPALWDLAGAGATASMSVRTIGSWTCAEAGWVSLGAGERAGGAAPRDAHCMAQSRIPAPVSAGGEWTVPHFDELEEANAAYNYGARLGSLAEAVDQLAVEQAEAAEEAAAAGEEPVEVREGLCVAAIGVGAALAAADPEGNLAFWGEDLDALPEAMAACDIVIVDPGVIVGDDAGDAEDTTTDYDALGEDDADVPLDEEDTAAGEETEPDPIRVAAASEADEAIGDVAAALPERWRLMVAGIADSAAPSSLHPVLYAGHGIEAGSLTSATTGRDGYVQLVDLAPTALDVVGADVPAAMSGRPASVEADPAHSSEAAVAAGVDETQASAAVAEVGWKFYGTLAALGVAAVAAAVWLLIGPDRLRPLARTVCVAVSAIPVAGVAAGIPPWWRADNPELAFWLVIAAGVTVLTAAAWLPGLRAGRRAALMVAGVTAGLIAVDQFTGATWPLHTPLGYTAQAGARFSGLGNYSFAVFAAAVVLIIALTPWRGRARHIGPVVLGAAATVLVGAPSLGGDVGGMLTIVAALVLACLSLWGRRLSIGGLAWAGGLAAAVFVAAGVLDYLRPEADQTHLGRFVGAVLEGSAGGVLLRKADSAISSIGTPLTYLVAAAAVGAWLIWRRRSPIRSASTEAATVGLVAVAVIGFSVNDSGIAVPGFATAVGFGLLAIAVGPRPEPPGPEAPARTETAGTARGEA
ncbi:hypothetical protein [Glycomyces tenuis]|uniref:hypothetical protein n=1 Tax=Glycomyces tenuis TaxID=58116 RepID=UPI00041F1173|nr:hypothetical protein [Glycomyces tenuis]